MKEESYKGVLRSFWGHVIEENQGDLGKIKDCFRGGKVEGGGNESKG